MIIYIKYNNKITIDIHKYSSVYKLKQLIKSKVKNKLYKYYLEYNGKILNDDTKSLDFYKINNNDIIDLRVKLNGGMETVQIILLVICSIVVFLVIPLLLFSGIIPFLLLYNTMYIIKIFESIIYYLSTFERIKNNKKILKFIVNIFIFIFKVIFIYFYFSYIYFDFFFVGLLF